MKEFEVVLRRKNGRMVKAVICNSKYAAKQQRRRWEAKYDQNYYVEVTAK